MATQHCPLASLVSAALCFTVTAAAARASVERHVVACLESLGAALAQTRRPADLDAAAMLLRDSLSMQRRMPVHGDVADVSVNRQRCGPAVLCASSRQRHALLSTNTPRSFVSQRTLRPVSLVDGVLSQSMQGGDPTPSLPSALTLLPRLLTGPRRHQRARWIVCDGIARRCPPV
jgi:hypothetical protein